MVTFWSDLAHGGWVAPFGGPGAPGETEDARRSDLRAQIDAIVAAQVFELDRSELEFVLDTFPTVRKYEEADLGEFRSRRLILEAYDSLSVHEVDGDLQPGRPSEAVAGST